MPVRGRCQGITSSCSKQSTLYKSHFVLLSALSQNEKCLSPGREGRQNIGLVGLASEVVMIVPLASSQEED